MLCQEAAAAYAPVALFYRWRAGPVCGRRLKGERLPTPAALAADSSVRWRTVRPTIYGRDVPVKIKTQVGMWYTVAYTRSVRIVVTRDPKGRIEDRAYFTIDLSLSAE